MRYRNPRFFGLILGFVLLLHLTGCGGGTSDTGTPNAAFPVVVFSDVHFDPFYDPGPSNAIFNALVAADPSQWAVIFKTSTVLTPSTWTKDTNYPLLVLALSSIRQNLGASPIVIFTGDILSHGFSLAFYTLYGTADPSNPTPADLAAMQAFADKTVAFLLQQVRSSVGNIPVMFALGNNDSYYDLGPDSTFLSNTAELFYTNFLKDTVDHQTFLNTFKAGGYYSAEPPGTNLMVIGLNTEVFSPASSGMGIDASANAELLWLDSTLASARDRGKKVWLLMHIPPGANTVATAQAADASGHIKPATTTMMWDPTHQTTFLQKLAKYPNLITLELAGHTHMDEYRIMSADNVLDITPGITPRSGNNPAYKVFTFSSDTLRPIDYTSLSCDLAGAPVQLNSYYTFSTSYAMHGLLGDSLAQLYPALATDKAKETLYRTYYFSGHYSGSVPPNPINDTIWPIFRCGIGVMDKTDFVTCVNQN
jgi:sphingomyelin phosphodiesterase acid-like 3